jgi:hypothetical protein
MEHKESPDAYGQRRANETGTRYVKTDMGHVMVRDRLNIRTIKEIGCVVVKTFKPTKKGAN